MGLRTDKCINEAELEYNRRQTRKQYITNVNFQNSVKKIDYSISNLDSWICKLKEKVK